MALAIKRQMSIVFTLFVCLFHSGRHLTWHERENRSAHRTSERLNMGNLMKIKLLKKHQDKDKMPLTGSDQCPDSEHSKFTNTLSLTLVYTRIN